MSEHISAWHPRRAFRIRRLRWIAFGLTSLNVIGALIGMVSNHAMSQEGGWVALIALPLASPLLFVSYTLFIFYWAGTLALLEHGVRLLGRTLPIVPIPKGDSLISRLLRRRAARDEPVRHARDVPSPMEGVRA